MLFTGYTELSIDAKGRLAIPAKYRNAWNPTRDGGAWFCVPWPGGVLRLYTESAFERMASLEDDSLTPSPDQAELDVNFFSQAERLEMDGSGRIMLPKRHLARVGLAQEGLPSPVAVVGARNRLEIRRRDDWDSSEEDRFERMPELVERIEKNRVSRRKD